MAKVIVAQFEGIHVFWKVVISSLFCLTVGGMAGALYNIVGHIVQ